MKIVPLYVIAVLCILLYSQIGYAQSNEPMLLIATNYNFDTALEDSSTSIDGNVRNDIVDQKGAASVNTFVFRIIQNIIIPLMILGGITIAIIGFYKMFVKESNDEITKGISMILYGVIGTVLMISARYIGNVVRSDMFTRGSLVVVSGVKLSEIAYNQILYPFLKLGLYLVIGLLFITLVVKVFAFLTSSEEDNQKKTITTVWTTILGILIILGAKQFVEAIYGKKADILVDGAIQIGEIGSGVLTDKHIPIIYEVVSWIMGLTAFVIMVFLLIQGIKLLTQPENDETIGEIKMYSLYAAIGLVVIGASYMITNFLIISG